MSTLLKNSSGSRMAELVRTNTQVFHVSDLATIFGIQNVNTLRVTLHRYAKEKLLYRVQRGLYSLIPPGKIDHLVLAAALLHRFCYVTTETVLRDEGVILQSQDALTFVSDVSQRFTVQGQRIVSRKLHEQFLHHPAGILTDGSVRRASVERAIADMLYFHPRYHFDHVIDWKAVRTLQQEIGYLLTPSRYADAANL